MNYKVKSLVYLFAFILSALLYHQLESQVSSEPIEQSKEMSMLGIPDTTTQEVLL